MSPVDIAAYIGAAAWLPQIISWLYKSLSKPKIKVILSPTIEVGYTTYGPIINLTCAISAENRDALINKVELVLRHEKGDTRKLTWVFLNEKQHEIRSYSGETTEVSKNQPAIALKVPTITLVEKQIGCQDMEFHINSKIYTKKIIELHNFLKKDNDTPTEQLIKSKELNDLFDYFKSQMYWQEGSYNLFVKVYEVRLKTPHTENFQFSLTKNDLESLNENCSKLESNLKFIMGISSDTPPKWNWIYPQVYKAP